MARALLLAFLLAGCQTVWVPDPPGSKTQAEFDRDAYECERDSAPVLDGARAALMRDRCMRVKGYRPQ